MAKRIPKPFRYRDGWRAQVTLKNGTRPHHDFDTISEANQWIVDTLANANAEQEPELGGPTRATLADALNHYAHLYTIAKGGAAAELNRINHYLVAQELPLLRAVKNEQDQVQIETYQPKAQPKGWQDHNDERRDLRAGTYELIGQVARKRCSALSTADIRKLMAMMKSEGLSDSTIQKEIALLRHLFNVAASEWNWKGFENPAGNVKLGKSEMRFVFLTKDQDEALWKAISECDNPYFWPLVTCGLETTMRKSSLRAMRWELTDLDGRMAQVKTKTGTELIPLSQHVVDVLRNMTQKTSGPVFPMSDYAIDMAWDGVRIKANLPTLQFRDLRHLGATAYARRGIGAHALQRILGHKSDRMAKVYVNLIAQDVLDAMDKTAPETPVFQVPPPITKRADDVMNERRAARIAKAVKQRLQEKDGSFPSDHDSKPAASSADPSAYAQLDNVDQCSASRPSGRSLAERTQAIKRGGVFESPSDGDGRSVDQYSPTTSKNHRMAATNVIQFRPRRYANS